MTHFDANPSYDSEKGFTLIETLVAVTLVVLMATGMISVFRTGTRSWARGTEFIDASQRSRIVYDLVRKQMASAFPLSERTDPLITNVTYPIFEGTESSLRFVSLNSLRFQESPGLTMVRYAVSQDSEEGAYALLGSEQPYIGQTLDSEESIDLLIPLSLFDNLSNCYFEYRAPDDTGTMNPNMNAQIEPGEWVREWNAEEQGQLPVAISMTMETLGSNGTARTDKIIVPIYANDEYTPSSSQTRSRLERLRGRRGRAGTGGAANDGNDNVRREIIQRNRGGGPSRGEPGFSPPRGGPSMGPGGRRGGPPGGGFGGRGGPGAGRGQ
jgi:prepilin-type N-terminal cleavage/methylation domain-containing protein